jgi:hypothetical protein
MKLLRIGCLAALTVGLLFVAVLRGYSDDQAVIRWFPGTGIAGKIDTAQPLPAYVAIEDSASGSIRLANLATDGTFIARLAPGAYRLNLPGDSRSVDVSVPSGHCVDLVLDFRVPGVVLQIPGEGAPIPWPANLS